MAHGSSFNNWKGVDSTNCVQDDEKQENLHVVAEIPRDVERSLVASFSNFSSLGGGWLGPDPSNDDKIQLRNWAKDAPEWRIAAEGLSFEAHCENTSCRAYNQGYVLVRWGYSNGGVFDFFRNNRDVKCPMCAKYVQVENFGFYNTQYKVTGSKKDTPRGFFQDVNTGWKSASADYYTTFLDDPNSLVYWGQLKVEVRKP